MPLKTYGIFTAYSPGTELRYEGLGRYLIAFVKHGTKRPDTYFFIACPSWSRTSLRALFDEAGIQPQQYEFIGPVSSPLLLSMFEKWVALRRRHSRVARKRPWIIDYAGNHIAWIARNLSITRNPVTFTLAAAYAGLLAGLASGAIALSMVVWLLFAIVVQLLTPTLPMARKIIQGLAAGLRRVMKLPSGLSFRTWLFEHMHRNEVDSIVREIREQRLEVPWYCPTAIWPTFAKADLSTLICVPDIVLAEFSVDFSRLGDESLFDRFEDIRSTLDHGSAFVTYSERIKYDVLTANFGVDPNKVAVIHHAPNALNHLVDVSGFGNSSAATKDYCELLLGSALRRNSGQHIGVSFGCEFEFLFYASQFRPSKNVIQLLRAYRYLLHERFFGHKLILTGRPGELPAIGEFVKDHGLQNDVLFLPGLSDAELAAAYKLADLAVNPSLSEGGMPFTFTEALSVGTPVVMSDIAVTREILVDERLRRLTLFDPYDWRSIAETIERALTERQELYDLQRTFFDESLAHRTWDDVVDEHLKIMDQLAPCDNRPTPR